MGASETRDDADLSHKDVLHRLGEIAPGGGLELIHRQDQTPLLAHLLQAAPLRYEFAPLQRGPAQWRTLVHVRDDRAPRSVTFYLAWDHDRLDALLARGISHARSQQWDDAAALIDVFRTGLFRHIEIEEKDLFPAFEDLTGIRMGGPTDVMRDEHQMIKESVNDMLRAALDHQLDEIERCHADLLGILVEHNMKEENILYPSTDRALDNTARNTLVERMLLR
ncbi:MAG: hemerythrin domain-containing protein [Planctomycetes bacterium]|nr:hemerythrin domain-containing protein [Planctomycetota bacterium]